MLGKRGEGKRGEERGRGEKRGGERRGEERGEEERGREEMRREGVQWMDREVWGVGMGVSSPGWKGDGSSDVRDFLEFWLIRRNWRGGSFWNGVRTRPFQAALKAEDIALH